MADETTLSPQESPENSVENKAPRTIPLNGFPPVLFQKMQPGFEEWNALREKPQSFSAYLIHMIQDAASIQEENEIMKFNLKAAGDQYDQDQAKIQDLSGQLAKANNVLEDLKEENESLRLLLNAKAKGREYALTVAARAVISQAAELTSPGIFNRLKTMTKEQYELLFNQIYLENFTEE